MHSSYLDAIVAACPKNAALNVSEPWITVRLHGGDPTPEQGWKLHLSAYPGTAREVLARALPVLVAHRTPFKLVASPAELARLNMGVGGPSQIGKFLTVYPASDEQAIALAEALEDVTDGVSGPAIPSDAQLRAGSIVYYRFGGFGRAVVQLRQGLVQCALITPDGDLVPDERDRRFAPPDWVVDPFARRRADDGPTRPPALGHDGRYRAVATLSDSGRGRVLLGLDTTGQRRCVMKTACRSGDVAEQKLRHEGDVLRRIGAHKGFPTLYDVLELDDEIILVMEDLGGELLSEHVSSRAATGRRLTTAEVCNLGVSLARLLGHLHGHGLVYRDLKSTNVILAPKGTVHLIDVEVVADAGSPGASVGTQGYMSPQQWRAESPSPSDDIYGLGALLYFAATGAEPCRAPDVHDVLGRPVRELNPAISPGLADLIAACLDPEPRRRPAGMVAVATRLAGLRDARVPQWPALGTRTGDEPETERRARCVVLARELGDTLCGEAETAPDGGLLWRSTIPGFLPIPYRPINTGVAGVVLALAELVAAFGEDRHIEALVGGCEWLERSQPVSGATVPGLYIGEAGVGAALLRAGQVLGDIALIEHAATVETRIRTYPYEGPDIFNGTAGRLRFALMLWQETGESDHLAHAERCAERLIAQAGRPADGELCWTIPEGYGGLSGETEPGYAHGAAGIADALLDLYELSGGAELADCALAAARWVRRQAMLTLPDSDGMEWGNHGMGSAGLWCRGASGVGRLFLRLGELSLDEGAVAVAEAAGRTVTRASRHASPVQCHGLAGAIEYLLDVHRVTGDPAWLEESWTLERLLAAFRLERNGRPTWGSDDGEPNSAYMVGYPGVVPCLLRLADPSRPHQLTLAGFRSGAQRVAGKLGGGDAGRAGAALDDQRDRLGLRAAGR